MSKQIVGYINDQYTYGEVEIIHKTDRVQIVRYGSASYALHVDGEYMSHHTTEDEARRYADMWVPPTVAAQPTAMICNITVSSYVQHSGCYEEYTATAETLDSLHAVESSPWSTEEDAVNEAIKLLEQRASTVAPAPQPVKEIRYDRHTHDYRMEIDSRFVGYAPTYHDAEVRLNQMVYDMLMHQPVVVEQEAA